MAEQPTIGKYHIQGLLKRGGMGVLYLGYDPELERQVAIKVIRTDSELEQLRERFVREAKAVARLRHPNIVTIFEFGTHDGLQFIVMEYIPGQNLAEFIQREAHAPMVRRLRLIDGACAGLGFAHRANIIHRDVKPANLMVDVDGTLKILDFGIARIAGAGLTSTGDIMGTINYMSPEQMTGARVDHRTDIFALGAVLYELVSGVRAFPGDRFEGVMAKVLHAEPAPLRSLCADLDPALEAIVHKTLAKNADDRYQDLGQLQRELAAVRERLERSAGATTVRSVVPAMVEAEADAPTTAAYLATTVPLKRFTFAAPVAKSRWVGLTTGAVFLGALTSVSWEPAAVVHAGVPETIVAAPVAPTPALPLSPAVPLRASPASAAILEHRPPVVPFVAGPLKAMPFVAWPAPRVADAGRGAPAPVPPDNTTPTPEPAPARAPALETVQRGPRATPGFLRQPMAAVPAEGERDADASETPKPVRADDRLAERAVRRSLEEYLTAIASLNPDRVGKVRRLDSVATEKIRRWLDGTRKLDVAFKSEPVIKVRQDSATAECVLHYRIQRSLGSAVATDVQTTFDLARVGDRWLIDRVTP